MIGTADWCNCLQKNLKYQRISWLLQNAAIWVISCSNFPVFRQHYRKWNKNLEVIISWVVVISTLWINACLGKLTFADCCRKKASCFTFAASANRLWQIGQEGDWKMKALFCGFDFLGDLNSKFFMKCLLGIFFLCCKLQQPSFLGYFSFAASLHSCWIFDPKYDRNSYLEDISSRPIPVFTAN